MKAYSKYTMLYKVLLKNLKENRDVFWEPGRLPDILVLEIEKNDSVYKASILENNSKITVAVEDGKREWHCLSGSAGKFSKCPPSHGKTFYIHISTSN